MVWVSILGQLELGTVWVWVVPWVSDTVLDPDDLWVLDMQLGLDVL